MKKAILEAFWISELRELNILRTYICPAVGQMEGILTSSVIWMYVTVKQKHVIETTRKKAVFVKIHNFTYLGFDNIFNFKIFKNRIGIVNPFLKINQTFKIWLISWAPNTQQ